MFCVDESLLRAGEELHGRVVPDDDDRASLGVGSTKALPHPDEAPAPQRGSHLGGVAVEDRGIWAAREAFEWVAIVDMRVVVVEVVDGILKFR